MHKNICFGVFVALILSGCGTIFNGQDQALSVQERHPITVDQQTYSIKIDVDPTLTRLPRASLAQLDAFLTAYRTRGHGPITVTAPSGTARDVDGQQTAANVRAALNAYGLRYEDMRGATYRSTDLPSVVVVSFSRYVASGPTCGVFKGDTSARLRNLQAPNFGCSAQANLAAMIADPRDLTRSQAMAASNGTAAAAALRSVHTGQNDWATENASGAAMTNGSGQ